MNIAIDGPAGAGKSSIAKLVAKKRGIVYVDTGAMFRAFGLACIRAGRDLDNESAVADCISGIDIGIEYQDGVQHIFLDGEDVSEEIRKEEVGKAASAVARYTAVRERLLDLQRDLAKKQSVIMDGRDIGTVVLPDAEVKIFLTASVDVRAMRRYKELTEKGVSCDLDEIKKDIADRDEQDRNRPIAPLKQADDAVLVDTSDMSIEQVVDRIMEIADGNKDS